MSWRAERRCQVEVPFQEPELHVPDRLPQQRSCAFVRNCTPVRASFFVFGKFVASSLCLVEGYGNLACICLLHG